MGDDKRMPHHISSIAHHFFASSTEPALRAASLHGPGPGSFHFAVASPGRGHLAAWTAVRLARASMPSVGAGTGGPSSRVVLSECHRQAWSVRAFLDGLDEEHLRGLFRPLPILDRLSQQGCPGSQVFEPVTDGLSERDGACDLPTVTWHNFGRCSESGLRRLSDLFDATSRFLDSPVSGVDGLVWCPLAEEADSPSGAWLLGSLASILGCRQAKILLFPSSRDIGARSSRESVSERGHLDSCRAVYSAALGECTFEVLAMPARRTGSEAERDLWSRLSESLKMGAATQRKQQQATLEETA